MTRKMSQDEVVRLFKRNSLKPLETYKNSQTPLKSECLKCNNIIFPRLDKVTLRGHQCGYCAGRKGADKKAVEIVRKIGHVPLEPYENALKPWKMRCGSCGKTISPKFNTLQQGGFGCKYCGHKKAGAKRREVGSKDALKIMREAKCQPIEPYPGSHVPWKSRCMKCDAAIAPRLSGIKSGQGGCPKCGIASRTKSRMHTPVQAERIAKKKKLKPLEPYGGSGKKWKCKCLRCGKVSSPYFQAIRDGVYGCGWCAKKLVDPSEARKMMVKAGLTPLVSYPGSDKGWLCRCNKCNREVTPAYGSIKVGQGGCKWCKDKSPWVDPVDAFNLMLKNQIQPLKPFKNSHTKWESRCLRCEKTVFPSYHQIAQGKGGCRYCAPNFVDEKRIYIVMKKAGLTPLTKYVNSKEPWKVKHEKCGRTFFVEYANIRGGSSCRYCAGLAVVPKEAVALLKQRGLTPLTPYPGGNKPWKCRCNVCQKVVSPRYTTVASRDSGCIYCAGRKVDPKDAVLFMKKNNLSPLVKYPGASKPWKCRCENCKRVIAPMYTSVRGRQGGCRFCADWGIDYGAEGFFYLMTHPKYRAHKVGIGNSKRSRSRSRITQHQKHGWKLFKKIDFAVTDDAFSLEQKVLDWLRLKKKLDVYLSEFEMPQGGYTETVDASEIDLPTIWAKVEEYTRIKR